MYTLAGGWLGSGADEGRGKLRKAPVRRTQSKTRGLPNETSFLGLINLRVPFGDGNPVK